ncbi:hypothetical protein TcasGA2_TC007448 [Tribolium castaneum]|uniref:Platelet-derived growth factor (PDGF) family profile domain-containing protein n=3 Tax=Tribolium castaneum TaxID=7070 RepID=A0A139WJG9_TRICA|nr:hypothetical protein TcasGA2_TC007448 [Tribolium castaneum]
MVLGALVVCLVGINAAQEAMGVFPDDLNLRGDYAVNDNTHFHHHHHHHHPGFHNHFDNDDEMGEVDENSKSDGSNGTLQIPLDFIKDLNQHNVSDLLLHYIEEDAVFLQDRFGGDEAEERSAATIPKGAPCMPELQTVNIAASDDPSVLYIPQCTRVERCGGCCSHHLLACQPETKEEIPFKVIKTQYTGGKKLKVLSKEVILVEKHTKCKCDCKVRAEDCNRFQEYRKSECRCACTNYDEEKKCNKNSLTKLWNPDLCACQCRETMQCSTGSYFDQNECKCLPTPVKRRFAPFQRRSYRTQPFPIVPLDDD